MNLHFMACGIRSEDSYLQLAATTQLLNLVSLEHNPPIDKVVKSGVVPRLVEFLSRDDNLHLQLGAARILKNITSGTSQNTQVVTDCGAVPAFVKLLGSSDLEICEQVIWSLGNIAGESSLCRDIVLSCGALHPLLTLLEKHKSPSFLRFGTFCQPHTPSLLRVGTWCLANIFEEGPIVPLEQLELAIRVLSFILTNHKGEVLKEACWALLHLSHCGGGIETAMYEADLVPKLAEFCQHVHVSALVPAIRAIRSILTGTKTLDKRALEAREVEFIGGDEMVIYSHIRKEVRSLSRLMDKIDGGIISQMGVDDRSKLRLPYLPISSIFHSCEI